MICPICQEYYEDGCRNPDCVERRSIREVMKKKSVSAAGRVLGDKNSSPDELSTAASVLGKSKDKVTKKEALEVFKKELQNEDFYKSVVAIISPVILENYVEAMKGGFDSHEFAEASAKGILDLVK